MSITLPLLLSLLGQDVGVGHAPAQSIMMMTPQSMMTDMPSPPDSTWRAPMRLDSILQSEVTFSPTWEDGREDCAEFGSPRTK